MASELRATQRASLEKPRRRRASELQRRRRDTSSPISELARGSELQGFKSFTLSRETAALQSELPGKNQRGQISV